MFGFKNCDFSGSDLSHHNLQETFFRTGCVFHNTNFENAELVGARFGNVDLKGAKFNGARIGTPQWGSGSLTSFTKQALSSLNDDNVVTAIKEAIKQLLKKAIKNAI